MSMTPNPQIQFTGKRKLDQEDAQPRRQRPPMPPPHLLASLVPESAMFEELLKMEQKLDWTMLRKKAEVNDALGKPIRMKRILRVFLSNTAYNQPWQLAGLNPGEHAPVDVNIETGQGVPGWTLRVEGRILDTGNSRIDRQSKKKFSNCIRNLIVEMDNREPQNFPEPNIVEWNARNLAPSQGLDGFELRRRGDMPIRCRIIMDLDQYPDRFKVVSPLSDLIGVKEESRASIMSAVWKFIKSVGAQDRDDVTKLRAVGGLEKIFEPGMTTMPFNKLPEIVDRFLTHPDPIIIPYQIRVDQERTVHPKCFDIPIELEDTHKSKMHAVIQSLEGPGMTEIMAAEDEVASLAQEIRTSRQKRDFLQSFATDPANFVNRWLATQARDLDLILGNQIGANGTNGGGVREEDLRRSDLFRLPWVEEAVTIQEGLRQAELAQKMNEARQKQQMSEQQHRQQNAGRR